MFKVGTHEKKKQMGRSLFISKVIKYATAAIKYKSSHPNLLFFLARFTFFYFCIQSTSRKAGGIQLHSLDEGWSSNPKSFFFWRCHKIRRDDTRFCLLSLKMLWGCIWEARLSASRVGKLLLANRGFHAGGQTSAADPKTWLQSDTTGSKAFTNACHYCILSNQIPYLPRLGTRDEKPMNKLWW